MATAKQIHLIVNDSAGQALGKTAVTVIDTGSLVSLGNQVFSSAESIEQFYKALTDRIGRTVFAVRELEKKERSVMREEMDWGIIYQKISYKLKNAVENASWETNTQADPFDVEISTEVSQSLFSALGTWSYEDSIPDYQLFTAFTNESAMGAFISGLYLNMKNSMTLAEMQTANMAVNTMIAGALIMGKPIQKRNLLSEFNAGATSPLTVQQALRNVDFLKFAGREIRTTIKNMSQMSQIYNAKSFDRHTPEDKVVVEVLSQFASATSTYLESDTYHKELVELPRYEEVVFWQGSGSDFGFESVSTINISNPNLITAENESGAISQSGIIACVHDIDACASIIYRRRSKSIYNPRAERYNIFEKADKGYAVDLSENCVVFYVA